jgi:hypothetical protein
MTQPSPAKGADGPRTEPPCPALEQPQTDPRPGDAPTIPAQPDPAPRLETRKTIAVDADRQVRGLMFALGCSVAIAIGVILTAIDIQSGRILDQDGHGWSFGLLFGPDVFSGINLQGWRVISEIGQLSRPKWHAELLIAFVCVDFVFIAVYALLLWVVISTIARGQWLTWARRLLWCLVVVDVGENLLALPGWPDVPASVVTATALKWAALLAIVVVLLLSVVTSPRNGSERSLPARIKRTWKAVMHQRFSFVPVVALFVLSVLSGAAILEQLPDVLRRWISDGGQGAMHAVLSMLSTVGLAVFLIIAGRYRSGYAFRHPSPPLPPVKEEEPPYLWVWLVGPMAAIVGLVVVLITGRGSDLLIARLLIFLLLPVVIIFIGSRLLRCRWEKHPAEYRYDQPPTFDERELTAVRLAGNIAGIGALTVGGLSLIRAYVPLVIVPTSATLAKPWLVWMFLAIGAGTVVVPWLVGMAIVRASAKRRTRKLDEGKPIDLRTNRRSKSPVGSWVLLGCAVGIFVLLGLFPSFAAAIGVAATATLALGSMAGMLSAVALIIQDRPTAEIFRAVGLHRSPLVTMLALTLVLVSIFGGQSSIHEVDRGLTSTSTDDTRLTMAESFDAWLRSPEPCLITPGGRPVRPMLLIAAEGGGIRAAYWTVRGLQAIADTTCGERSALFSAGASGGSVGLTVARLSGTPDSPNSAAAVDAVKKMAAPGILSRAADGTFVRDLVYGANGVPVQRYGESDWAVWKDRARLIEDGWAAARGKGGLDWGDRDFLTASDQLSPLTGQLILNSTDVKHTCRVWVSQVNPGLPVTETGEATFDPERSCDKTPGPGARTIDLFTAYGPFVSGSDPKSCLGRIRSSTAALLTARFPYVTPSAVIGPCPAEQTAGGKALPYWPRTQLVDGGYIENSGLATITDLSDDWLSLVRGHNAKVLDTKHSTEPLVVPIIVFLTNGDRAVVQPAIDSSPTSELAVPLLTFLSGRTSLTGNDALLERARAAVEIDGFCPVTKSACAALQRHFPSRVVVVDRVTQPEIGAPLGWVMSEASITSMDMEITQSQLQTRCNTNTPHKDGTHAPVQQAPVQADLETQPSCRTGYATLGDLVRYYNTTS